MYGERPDITMAKNDKKLCEIIDFVYPNDGRVDAREFEKIEHCQDLARELKKIWNKKVKVTPLVLGTLGTTPTKLRKWLREIGIETQISELEKTVHIHTAQILPKVLDIKGNLPLQDLKNIIHC